MTDDLLQPPTMGHHRPIVYHAGRKQYHLGSDTDAYLTRREAECALLILHGRSNKKAAAELGLSPRTIEYYLKNIRAKLSCYNRSHLIRVLKSLHFEQVIDFILDDILCRMTEKKKETIEQKQETPRFGKVLW